MNFFLINFRVIINYARYEVLWNCKYNSSKLNTLRLCEHSRRALQSLMLIPSRALVMFNNKK